MSRSGFLLLRLLSASICNKNGSSLAIARPLFTLSSQQPPAADPVMGPWCRTFVRGARFSGGYSAFKPKTLGSIMNLDRVKNVNAEELTSIWSEYHIGRGHISAVMDSNLFNVLQHRTNACPIFVIPMPRPEGYISVVLQAQMPHLLFTGLGDFKARGSDATPYLTVTHYSDFAESKGLVLVRGDVVLTSKIADAEARKLLKDAHSFYLNNGRYRKVMRFNHESDDFDFQEVLQELGM